MFENSPTEGHETSLGVNSPAALLALSEKKKPLKCDPWAGPWATELLRDSEFTYVDRRILENWGNYEVRGVFQVII